MTTSTSPDNTAADNTASPDHMTDEEFYEALQRFVGLEAGPIRHAPDEVNQPMIRHMVETLGDHNPIYTDPDAAAASIHGGIVAPPTMLQAWVMFPFGTIGDGGDSPYDRMNELLFSHGFRSVVATNCEQEYLRYLRPGDRLYMRAVIESISPQKTTALGTGHFITTRQNYYDEHDELVGSMLFRLIRFRPPERSAAPPERPPRPMSAVTQDMQFFFDALAEDHVRVQRCTECSTLRHPPGPMCPNCHSLSWEAVDIAGTGEIHSFIIVHHPQVPSFDYPLPVVLVELTGQGEQGLRMVMNTADCAPEDVVVGLPVRIEVRDAGHGMKLPFAILEAAG